MKLHRTYLHTLCLSLIFSIPVLASEKFVVSAALGTNVVLKVIELDQTKIKVHQSVMIDTHHFVSSTAVLSRFINDERVHDLALATCMEADDIFCDHPSLSLLRLDSDLNVQSRRDYAIPTWSVSMQRLRMRKATEWRILLYHGYKRKTSERILRENGVISNKELDRISDPGKMDPTVSEDGKIAASAHGTEIRVWPVHPTGPVNLKQASGTAKNVALSGPLSVAGSDHYRFLLFRTYRGLFTQSTTSQVILQKLDSSTGKFLGGPAAFTAATPFSWDYAKNIDISHRGNLVLYTENDGGCRKNILLAQPFDPQKQERLGRPRILIGCSDMPGSSFPGITGIDITTFVRKPK